MPDRPASHHLTGADAVASLLAADWDPGPPPIFAAERRVIGWLQPTPMAAPYNPPAPRRLAADTTSDEDGDSGDGD